MRDQLSFTCEIGLHNNNWNIVIEIIFQKQFIERKLFYGRKCIICGATNIKKQEEKKTKKTQEHNEFSQQNWKIE